MNHDTQLTDLMSCFDPATAFGGAVEATQMFGSPTRDSFYEILGVRPDASRATIRDAYMRMKRSYADESNALYSLIAPGESRALQDQIEEAFRVLGDDIARANYDQRIGIARPAAPVTAAMIDTSTPRGLAEAEARAELQASAMTNVVEPPKPVDTAPQRRSLSPLKSTAPLANAPATRDAYRQLLAAFAPDDGELIKRLREAANVNEDEVQRWTRMSLEHIRAIESNRLQHLPPVVYVKGYLRSLFKYLAVPDHERLVTAFATKLQACLDNKRS